MHKFLVQFGKLRRLLVAQKKPNAWGFYEVHDSAWEWCKDMWHPGYNGAAFDGSAWQRPIFSFL